MQRGQCDSRTTISAPSWTGAIARSIDRIDQRGRVCATRRYDAGWINSTGDGIGGVAPTQATPMRRTSNSLSAPGPDERSRTVSHLAPVQIVTGERDYIAFYETAGDLGEKIGCYVACLARAHSLIISGISLFRISCIAPQCHDSSASCRNFMPGSTPAADTFPADFPVTRELNVGDFPQGQGGGSRSVRPARSCAGRRA